MRKRGRMGRECESRSARDRAHASERRVCRGEAGRRQQRQGAGERGSLERGGRAAAKAEVIYSIAFGFEIQARVQRPPSNAVEVAAVGAAPRSCGCMMAVDVLPVLGWGARRRNTTHIGTRDAPASEVGKHKQTCAQLQPHAKPDTHAAGCARSVRGDVPIGPLQQRHAGIGDLRRAGTLQTLAPRTIPHRVCQSNHGAASGCSTAPWARPIVGVLHWGCSRSSPFTVLHCRTSSAAHYHALVQCRCIVRHSTAVLPVRRGAICDAVRGPRAPAAHWT